MNEILVDNNRNIEMHSRGIACNVLMKLLHNIEHYKVWKEFKSINNNNSNKPTTGILSLLDIFDIFKNA